MKLGYRNQKNAELTAKFWGKSLERPDWFRCEQTGSDQMEVWIYDIIGWPWSDVQELNEQISANKDKDLLVRLNTPGGDVFDGMSVFNALKDHPRNVTTRIEGLAASMGSVIALAGEKVIAYENAMFVIHEPWSFVVGNRFEMRKRADLLDKIAVSILNVYVGKAGKDQGEIEQAMKEETWYSADEAKTAGFIDEILNDPAANGAKSRFDLSMFAHAPEGNEPQGRDLSAREMERALRDAGSSRSFAKKTVNNAFPGLRDADLEGVMDAAENLLASLRGE